MLIAKAASQRHTEHGHRKIIATLDAAVAFFTQTWMEVIYAHPPAEAEPARTVAWLLLKSHHGTRKASRLWPDFLRNDGGVEDRCVSTGESDVGGQGGHQSACNHSTWSGHRSQDRETSRVVEPSWFHVESNSKTRA